MKFIPPGDTALSVSILEGHSIVIEPKGTDVDPKFRKAAIAAGCMPVGIGAEEAAATTKEATRSELVAAAIEKLLDGNDEKAFDKHGKPVLAKVSAAAGFTVTREEADAAFATLSADVKTPE